MKDHCELKLPVVEQFYSLQGEGAHTGRAAWFVRLAGCDVGCRWCDSRASWNAKDFPMVEVDKIVEKITNYELRITNYERATRNNNNSQFSILNSQLTVVVTGGEPLTHNLDELCARLHERGFAVHLETSGTHPFSGDFDWVCLSPKRQCPPLDEAWGRADEVKVVVETEDDLKEITNYELRITSETQLFLQPEWNRAKKILPHIIRYIKQNPRWRLSLQAHKYIGIE